MPALLLNIPQFKRKFPVTKIIHSKMSEVPRLWNSVSNNQTGILSILSCLSPTEMQDSKTIVNSNENLICRCFEVTVINTPNALRGTNKQ